LRSDPVDQPPEEGFSTDVEQRLGGFASKSAKASAKTAAEDNRLLCHLTFVQ
jgi:hypothetical protein